MHRAIEGCARLYFGMSVSAAYLEATVNTAAVARHRGVQAFVNLSQMTVSQMSITETTASPQHKLHWLAQQALSWSGLRVVTVRPTVFLEGFFLRLVAAAVREADELTLPMGRGKTSPISAVDVARAVAVILQDPAPHLGQVYNLTLEFGHLRRVKLSLTDPRFVLSGGPLNQVQVVRQGETPAQPAALRCHLLAQQVHQVLAGGPPGRPAPSG
jgi:hypothetical protein